MFDPRYGVSRVSARRLGHAVAAGHRPCCCENRRPVAPRRHTRNDILSHVRIRMTWVWPVQGRIKEQTVDKPVQPKVHRRTSCGLRIFEPFRLSNSRV